MCQRLPPRSPGNERQKSSNRQARQLHGMRRMQPQLPGQCVVRPRGRRLRRGNYPGLDQGRRTELLLKDCSGSFLVMKNEEGRNKNGGRVILETS